MTSTDRTAYTQGLRKLAQALDADPSLSLPYEGTNSPIAFFVDGKDLEPALRLRVLMTNPVTSHSTSITYPVQINGLLYGLRVYVCIGARIALTDSARSPHMWPACDPRLGFDTARVAS